MKVSIRLTAAQLEAVAIAGREIRHLRAEALKNNIGGLRNLYRTLEVARRLILLYSLCQTLLFIHSTAFQSAGAPAWSAFFYARLP
jgi:hypothetical protein